MADQPAFLRDTAIALDTDQLLQAPVSEILGVDAPCAAALNAIGITSIFDLGGSALFADAVAIARAADPRGLSVRQGRVPADWLAHGASQAVDSAKAAQLGLKHLRGISEPQAQALEVAIDVKTIAELSRWPAYRYARDLVSGVVGSSATIDEAEELRPRMGDYPTERVYYDTLVMLSMEPLPANQIEAVKGPLSLSKALSGSTANGLNLPAIGAKLTFSQSWFAQGITLGHMLHSLALAPGEHTRVAVIDWSRKTTSTATETITESEKLDTAANHSRALSEVQNAVASELQQGGSQSSSSANSSSGSVQGSAGSGLLSSLAVSWDVSGTYQNASNSTEAASSSWSSGTRSVTASMAQNINDRTEQHSTSVRNRRASAVREVSQSEHEQVSTRVVANYNHMHALTVQYYEVVQVYRVQTQLHQAERVLFVPMAPLDFEDDSIVDRFRAVLIRAALNRRVVSLLIDDVSAVELRPTVSVKLPERVRTLPALAATGTLLQPQKMLMSGASVFAGISVTAAAALAPAAASGAPASPAAANSTGTTNTVNTAPLARNLAVRVWDGNALQIAASVLGRSLLRVDSDHLYLPDEAVVESISFEGIGAASVRLERTGGDAARTITVAENSEWVDVGDVMRLVDLTGISVAKRGQEAASGYLRLHLAYLGRRLATPPIPVELPAGREHRSVLALANDRDDRRKELKQHLTQHRSHYGSAIFRNLDSATLCALLSQYGWKGRPLIEVCEPKPLRVAGNYLVLRAPVEPNDVSGAVDAQNAPLKWADLLKQRGIEVGKQSDQRLVPLPTAGVFAEAVLGRSNSAEKLDITRFWNWQDSPIPLQAPEIAPVSTGSRGTTDDLKPGQLSAPVLNIVQPTSLPDPSGLAASLTAVANGNMFRDMSGLAGTQVLAGQTAQNSANLATDAGQLASANLRTEAQKAVAMGQIAADLAKSAMAAYTGVPAAGGGGSVQGISAQGALINHGSSMDQRTAPSPVGGSSPTIQGDHGESGGGSAMPGADGVPVDLGGCGLQVASHTVPGGGSGAESAAFSRALWGGLGASGVEAAGYMTDFSLTTSGAGAQGGSGVSHGSNLTNPGDPRTIIVAYGFSGDGMRTGTFPSGTDNNLSFQLVAETLKKSLEQVYTKDDVVLVKAWQKDDLLAAIKAVDETQKPIRQLHLCCHGDSTWLSLAYHAPADRLLNRAKTINALAMTEDQRGIEALKQEDAIAAGYFSRAVSASEKATLRKKFGSNATWQIWGCFAGDHPTVYDGHPDPDLDKYFKRLNFGATTIDSVSVEIAKELGIIVTAATGAGGLEFWVTDSSGKVIRSSTSTAAKQPFWLWRTSGSKFVSYDAKGALRAQANLFGRDRDPSLLPGPKPPQWLTDAYSVASPTVL